MAKYRQVQTSFWQDPFILELTPEEKYFYLYLMTNPKTSASGVYELPMKVMVFETGYNADTIQKLIHKFEDYGKIRYSPKTSEILLVNWLKHNNFQSPKTQSCIKKEWEEIKNSEFRDYIADVMGWGMDTPSIPHPYPMGDKEIEYEYEKEKEERNNTSPKAFADDSPPMLLAKKLQAHILSNNPRAKTPSDLQKWALEFDRMMRLDKRSYDEIVQVIEFSQNDSFWMSNILSAKKLREQFDRLYLQSQRGQAPRYTHQRKVSEIREAMQRKSMVGL